MNITTLITHYGYVAIFLGTFFEGETILVIAGFLAHQGYLAFPYTVGAAFLGAMLGDQLYFHIGRRKGRAFIDKRASLHRHVARVEALLQRHEVLLILGFRFLYGLRTVTPVILGVARVNPILFFILNSVSAMLWALAITTGGYYFGKALESLFGQARGYEMLVMAAIAGLACGIWVFRRVRQKHHDTTKR